MQMLLKSTIKFPVKNTGIYFADHLGALDNDVTDYIRKSVIGKDSG